VSEGANRGSLDGRRNAARHGGTQEENPWGGHSTWVDADGLKVTSSKVLDNGAIAPCGRVRLRGAGGGASQLFFLAEAGRVAGCTGTV
jgi:hypothetical protein